MSSNELSWQVARTSDFGKNDRILSARTHLGHLLHVGDTVLGYDLLTAQLVSPELERAQEKGLLLPDVILVGLSVQGTTPHLHTLSGWEGATILHEFPLLLSFNV